MNELLCYNSLFNKLINYAEELDYCSSCIELNGLIDLELFNQLYFDSIFRVYSNGIKYAFISKVINVSDSKTAEEFNEFIKSYNINNIAVKSSNINYGVLYNSLIEKSLIVKMSLDKDGRKLLEHELRGIERDFKRHLSIEVPDYSIDSFKSRYNSFLNSIIDKDYIDLVMLINSFDFINFNDKGFKELFNTELTKDDFDNYRNLIKTYNELIISLASLYDATNYITGITIEDVVLPRNTLYI